ncbi:uncharacterized protein [Spinacia oleracea]|uniref:Uncharacterized protein isoform X2 n=1 Tax=Spinacia oleracea TaxID=3562 RepID=A0ABM3R585_SPIOL|nr:uncharacterized protein LOC110800506 isoform X2 [Spinacia oleracea]
MSNLAKLEIVPLDITGKNYLSWVLDAEIHLDAKGLGDTIKEGNKATCQDKAKAMIFLRHHLHEGLKTEYLRVKDPQILWSNLKERYDHQKTVIFPKALYDWLHLRLQDFKFTQYREKGFKKYSEFISCLLVAEQNNELLMYNHEARPTGSTPFPEANVGHPIMGKNQRIKTMPAAVVVVVVVANGEVVGVDVVLVDMAGRGSGGYYKSSHSHQKWDRKDGKSEKGKGDIVTSVCYRCGGKGHWSRVCHTPKHLVDLYQQSLKKKGKNVETNLVFEDGEGDFDSGDTTHLEVADFFTSPEGNN